jgi:hypothetical protein
VAPEIGDWPPVNLPESSVDEWTGGELSLTVK